MVGAHQVDAAGDHRPVPSSRRTRPSADQASLSQERERADPDALAAQRRSRPGHRRDRRRRHEQVAIVRPHEEVVVDGPVTLRDEVALDRGTAPQEDPGAADAVDQSAPGHLGDEDLVGVVAQVGVERRLHAGRRLVPEPRAAIHAHGVPRRGPDPNAAHRAAGAPYFRTTYAQHGRASAVGS